VLIKKAPDIRYSEVTPRKALVGRRHFLASAGAALAAVASGKIGVGASADSLAVTKRVVTTTDPVTPYNVVTTYNNFYEFGTKKGDPAINAKAFKTKPWSVTIEGACGKPGVYPLDDILKPHALEERVYRHRCVEGWSIVVPWIGFPLGDLLKRFEPAGNAAFVEFVTVMRPDEMPEQRGRWLALLPWPYNEGLRMTRRCTRWRWPRSACTARRCPTRTARRSALSSPGSTASRASSRSTGSASSRNNRRRRG
jgi:Sulfite oxidase and related enzymes